MSLIKRWYEENIDNLTDEELIKMGHPKEDIEWLQETFSNKNEYGKFEKEA